MKAPLLLEQFERLERLIEKLPEGLQKPILREIVPLKELFLRGRPPRLALVGDASVEAPALFAALADAELEAHAGDPRAWRELTRGGRGSLRLLDARATGGVGGISDHAREALTAEPPDLVLFLENAAEGTAGADVSPLETLVQLVEDRHGHRPGLIGVAVAGPDAFPSAGELEAARRRLELRLADCARIGGHLAPVLAVGSAVRFRPDGSLDAATDARIHTGQLSDLLATELPNEAKLELVRLTGAKQGQLAIARALTKSMSAAAGAIGAQPIPLADLPFLLALQVLMVTGILYASGREANVRSGFEFLGALGFNFGAGLALREIARSLVKLFPGWGNAISGLIAAGGTYALGRTATAYFIDGIPLKDAKKLFRRMRRQAPPVLEDRQP